jgi:hypothetical protein
VKNVQIRKRSCLGRDVVEPQHDAEMQVLEAVNFEKRIMLRDCRDANTVVWRRDSKKETR